MSKRLFTSESVTEGHPDKMADQISDAILDDLLRQDPRSRVAVETMLTTGQVHVAGDETFMHLSVAGLQPGSQGSVLLRRMVALLLLRLVGLEKLPDAIVLDWWDGDLGPVLRELAVKCAGARVYPEADTTVVSLPTAALSHRVARFLGQPRARTPNGAGGALLVVDLRHVAEETLVEHARSLHRVRLSRKGIVPPVMPLILADYRRGVAQRP